MVLSDHEIIERVKNGRMIEPFVDHQVSEINGVKVVSFGLSSAGYDFRITDEFRVFTNALCAVVDPKDFDPTSFVEFRGSVCTIPPNSFVLARSLEYFCIPRDIITLCVGKSTYARCGIIINVTPFEPEWEGFATMEIANATPLPALIYAFEGIAQVIFLRIEEEVVVSYADRQGKYQRQMGIVLPRVG